MCLYFETSFIFGYFVFIESKKVNDPKERIVLVAQLRDRLLHRVIYDSVFAELSKKVDTRVFSGIEGRGLYKCLDDTKLNINKSKHRDEYFIKFDIKKFYESIGHDILKSLLIRYFDNEALNILHKVIDSDSVNGDVGRDVGIPLGNLTSQIFGILYLNELDRFITHGLKIKNWHRYGDDYLILLVDSTIETFNKIKIFTRDILCLEIHKVKVMKISEGIKFLNTNFYKSKTSISTTAHKKFMSKVTFHNYSTYKDIYNRRASKIQTKELFDYYVVKNGIN